MDNVSRPFYELKFKNKFLELKGNAFQDFFSAIMQTCYPSDFIPIRTWGSYGDRKNDGYLTSNKTVHQVYAPNDMSASEAISKIEADFYGALDYWGSKMDKWVFVHNSYIGLSAEVVDKLEDLKKENPSVEIGHMGFSELRERIFSLNDNDIESILGPAPSERAINDIQFKDLRIIIKSISGQDPPVDVDLRPVPLNKIHLNHLSSDAEILIRAGMKKSPLVCDFFTKWHDPMLGDNIGNYFQTRYLQLKSANLTPDDIYFELINFETNSELDSTRYWAAKLAVVSYFFEECDIFERFTEEDYNT